MFYETDEILFTIARIELAAKRNAKIKCNHSWSYDRN